MPDVTTQCSKCKREISNLALTCPLCGTATERAAAQQKLKRGEERQNDLKRIMYLLGFLALGFLVWSWLGDFVGIDQLEHAGPKTVQPPAP